MTNPEHDGAGDLEQSKLDESRTTTVDLENPDDSKAQLINANGGAGTDVRFEGTAASSDGEVSFNGLGKEEVMRYADEPFWKRLRIILLVLFWIGWLAMLVTAVIIIAMAPRCPPRADLKWYQQEAVYQVNPESFKDSNGDCIGDFPGLKEKMPYLDDLGVKAIWLNNIYKTDDDLSELGVLNHKALKDHFLATPADLEAWMKTLQKEGKKVILDLNINQVSKQHEWFKLFSTNAENGKYKNYFIVHDGPSAPNNWKTLDKQSAWTKASNGLWVYGSLGGKYPDLNLTNPDVVDEVKKIMTFWFSAGVSGFHIKDVEYLVEDVTDEAHGQKHTAGTGALLEELRAVADSFSQKPGRERFLFGTVYDNSGNITSLWGDKGGKRRLHMVMPLMKFFDKDTDANLMAQKVDGYLPSEEGANQWLALGLGNQYVSRIASRVDGQTHKLIPAHALQMLLPGTPFNFYGDEFGQLNGFIAMNTSPPSQSTSNTPMQWNAGKNAGFCGAEPSTSNWLQLHGVPAPSTYKTNNLKNSQGHFDSKMSTFDVFRNLLALRQRESFQWGKTSVCSISSDVFSIRREAERFPPFVVLMNVGATEQHVDLTAHPQCVGTKAEATVAFHSSMPSQVGESISDFHEHSVILQKGDVVVLEFPADEP